MVNLIKIGNSYNQIKNYEYMIESPSEIAQLPTDCAIGSRALDVSTGVTYVFWSTKEWKVLPAPAVKLDIPNAEEGEF